MNGIISVEGTSKASPTTPVIPSFRSSAAGLERRCDGCGNYRPAKTFRKTKKGQRCEGCSR